MTGRRSGWLITALGFGLVFLYLPIVLVMIYSFNASRLVTVWGGFSTHWYGRLLQNDSMLAAAWNSFKIAVLAASLALVLGTLAGFAMARFGRFSGRTLFSGLLAAPLVMPEVITGLSLLLLFVAMESFLGWPAGRGIVTITIAHTTFCTAYVAIIVQSRLAGMDTTLEEAAMDLGARPVKVFTAITLPLMTPALLAGWLLSFTLSLDDLVIASFVSGPGATTLPMKVFSSVRLGVSPEINALATLIVAVVSLGIILAGWLLLRRDQRLREQG